LLDIATQHASGEEVVGAAFTLAGVGAAASGGQIMPPNGTIRGTKKGAKVGKKEQKHCPHCLGLMMNNGNPGQDIKDSNEEFMAAAEHDFKWHTRPPKDHIEKILEATCPHQPYPIKHKLRDCSMMKRFMSSACTPPGGDKLARDPRGGAMVRGVAEVTTIAG
jgi:hypothetical protein